MFGSSRHHLSSWLGSLIGVALTSIVFLATQDMTPTVTLVIVGCGVVSLILAILLARPAVEGWSTIWFLVSIGVTIPLVYKAYKALRGEPEPRLAAVELPGFTIDLLEEEVGRFSTEYDFGWLDVRDQRRGLWTSVLWRAGTLDTDAGTPEHVADWMAAFDYNEPITVREPIAITWPDLETRTYKLFIGLKRTDSTFIACGKRLIAVITAGEDDTREGVGRLHRGTVASVVCTPDADEEVAIGAPPPVRLSPPGGWEVRDDLDPLWTAWGSENGSMLFMYFYRGHKNLGDMKSMVTDGIGQWGTVAEVGSERVGEVDVWRGTLTDDTGVDQVHAFSATCGRRPLLAILFGRDGVEEARASFLAARCEL